PPSHTGPALLANAHFCHGKTHTRTLCRRWVGCRPTRTEGPAAFWLLRPFAPVGHDPCLLPGMTSQESSVGPCVLRRVNGASLFRAKRATRMVAAAVCACALLHCSVGPAQPTTPTSVDAPPREPLWIAGEVVEIDNVPIEEYRDSNVQLVV